MTEVTLRLAGITRESVVDGPGIRAVVYAQGCPHRCKGCHNPETHDPDGGRTLALGDIVDQMRLTPIVRGITFSGGEPFAQAGGFALLGRRLKRMGFDIVTYTGYTWDELVRPDAPAAWRELLDVTDILVDGPFLEGEKDANIAFRGSRNQRIIDVKGSLRLGAVVDLGRKYDLGAASAPPDER
ncbi:MAG: anaerobic ribonucleoside-triphosphate reductase activating protein [Firmicutes bacterium]|jgi:anaerobic ribonucleoside-triphosphate reductase activating protein|nr:anaerobic ribonucleoside-triphosphate reductase activating protein [Bacillota bacterium]MDH7496433.1 anaerobic ribonucleoside-triphosphate reductase activating protein [Bacillota bacterium]